MTDRINRLVDAWYLSTQQVPLHTFLGMTWEEYAEWLMSGSDPRLRVAALQVLSSDDHEQAPPASSPSVPGHTATDRATRSWRQAPPATA